MRRSLPYWQCDEKRPGRYHRQHQVDGSDALGDQWFFVGMPQQTINLPHVALTRLGIAQHQRIAAGCALGLAGASQLAACRERGVIARPLAGLSPKLTTYLLRPDQEPTEIVARLIECVHAVEATNGDHSVANDQPDMPEETES